jgi:hypothetical protein
MHTCDLVELAGILSDYGPMFLLPEKAAGGSGLNQYWAASRCRLDRWGRLMRRFTDDKSIRCCPKNPVWLQYHAVFEEILISELLTRVFAAMMTISDRRLGISDQGPIARSVVLGHMEARNRLMGLLAGKHGVPDQTAAAMNRLRNRVEHWTDVFLGKLTPLTDLAHLGFDEDRVRRFGKSLGTGTPKHDKKEPGNVELGDGRFARWDSMRDEFRAAFLADRPCLSPNFDLNEQIAGGVLLCFSLEMLAPSECARSIWLCRLVAVAENTQGLLSELLETG